MVGLRMQEVDGQGAARGLANGRLACDQQY